MGWAAGTHPAPTPIAQLPLFKDLDGAALGRLTMQGIGLCLQRGDVPVRKGEPAIGIHVVVDGEIPPSADLDRSAPGLGCLSALAHRRRSRPERRLLRWAIALVHDDHDQPIDSGIQA